MEEYTVPEIKRQDLAQVILKLIALGLNQPEDFPFVEKPQSRSCLVFFFPRFTQSEFGDSAIFRIIEKRG